MALTVITNTTKVVYEVLEQNKGCYVIKIHVMLIL